MDWGNGSQSIWSVNTGRREVPEADQPRSSSQGDLINPSTTDSNDQLLWDLGIPVYSDGRVEAERVARVYREVLYPALARAGEDRLHQQRATQAAVEMTQRLGELTARVQEMEDRLKRQDADLLARAGALAALEQALGERGARLDEEAERCEAALTEARQTLAQAQHVAEAAGQLKGLLVSGHDLLHQISEAMQDAERSAEVYAHARQALSLAVSTEEQARQSALDASKRLQEAAEYLIQDGEAPGASPSSPIRAGRRWYAAQRTSPPDRDPRRGDQASDGVRMVEVRFTDAVLLPAARLEVKRRLLDILGAAQVQDAANGRDLVLRCQKKEVDFVTAAALEMAADLDVEVAATAVAGWSEEPAAAEEGDEDEDKEPGGLLTIVDWRGADRSQWLAFDDEDDPSLEAGDE